VTESKTLEPGQIATVQVLGAIAYGEWKAHVGAKEAADAAATEDERAAMKKVAAEELRHHKGFVRALERMGADPERAMAPYQGALDSYHGNESDDPLENAMWGYLGEGVADDLLEWLKTVVDAETREFVESVIADEEEHEALATARLKGLIDADPAGKAKAGRAARTMLARMARASGGGETQPLRFGAFLRMGRPHDLLWRLTSGYARRMRALGLNPVGLPALLPNLPNLLPGRDRQAA